MSNDDDISGILGLEDSAIRLCDHSAQWAPLYQREAAAIRSALGSLIVDIQHFGSTSVPELKAKPIIDILVGLASFSDGPRCIPLLEDVGYAYAPEVGIPGDYSFDKGRPRTHWVHVVQFGSMNWSGNLKFRDALRKNRDLAHAYEELKIGLSRQFQDRASYTQGKSEFVMRVVSEPDMSR